MFEFFSFKTITKIILNLTKEGIRLVENRREKAIKEYVNQVYLGTVSENKKAYEKIIKKDKEYYEMLLTASATDEDTRKATIYANVYINIEKDKIEQNKRIHIIKMVKDMTYFALTLIPKLYIYKHYHTKNMNFSSYLESIKKNYPFEYNELIFNNIFEILFKRREYKPVIQLEEIKHKEGIDVFTNNFDEIARSIFTEQELTPESQNIEIWNKKVGAFIFLDADNKNSNMNKRYYYLKNLLNIINIGLEGQIIVNEKEYYHKFIVIFGSNKLGNNLIEHYINISKKVNIVKITFENNVADQLPMIDGELFYLKEGNKKSEQDFLKLFL